MTSQQALRVILSSAFLLISFHSLTQTHSATIEVTNNCQDPVWAAGVPGGGQRLEKGQKWTVEAPPGTTGGRIWARTGCQFDPSGSGKCETGDCGGKLACTSYGAAPNTLAEFAIGQFANQDFIDISVIDGFNVPMEFSSASGQCSRVIRCTGNIIQECPNQLKVPGGCNGACPQLKEEQYCCANSGNNCFPTDLSRFFKDRCPDAYSYPKDDATSTFTCPTGTNYKVIFCP